MRFQHDDGRLHHAELDGASGEGHRPQHNGTLSLVELEMKTLDRNFPPMSVAGPKADHQGRTAIGGRTDMLRRWARVSVWPTPEVALPTNLRRKILGRKTYIALNRSAVRADGITSGRLGQHFMPGRS